MKKIIILATLLTILCGCASAPKTYGNAIDWSVYDSEDSHVYYCVGKDGFYSDGSAESNMLYDSWVDKYEGGH